MKKNALVLFGSPHSDGHTRKLLDHFKATIPNFNFFEFDAYKELLQPCHGCNSCQYTANCCLSDFHKIDFLINDINPEILIIASAIYNFGFPSPLKAFFDRLQPYYNNPRKNSEYKNAFLLLTAGRALNYKEDIEKKLNIILKPLGFKITDSLVWDNTDSY